ncbi:hypothetical protein CL650_001250 [bacterium]|nr:hypothetical protein [bacterium]
MPINILFEIEYKKINPENMIKALYFGFPNFTLIFLKFLRTSGINTINKNIIPEPRKLNPS